MTELTKQQIAKMAEYKLLGTTSCLGCKFYFHKDYGYSNWTVEETQAHCAIKRNPNLPAVVPYDQAIQNDNWPATKNSRCELFANGEPDEVALISIDVDNENPPERQSRDHERIAAISNYLRGL